MPGGLVGMHEARAGRGMVGVSREDGLAEPGAEHDAAVPGRHVTAPIPVHAVWRAAEFRVFHDAEQVRGDRAQRGPLAGWVLGLIGSTPAPGAASWPGWRPGP